MATTPRSIADWTRRLGLTEEEAAELIQVADETDRPITNVVRQLVREGLRLRKKGRPK